LARHRYRIDGQVFEVDVRDYGPRSAEVSVNGRAFRVERAADDLPTPSADLPQPQPQLAPVPRPRRAQPVASELRAPMAGLVVQLEVSPGDRVAAGDAVLVLDAMKMENAIRAPHAGVVREVFVRAGDSVLTGAPLARIDAG